VALTETIFDGKGELRGLLASGHALCSDEPTRCHTYLQEGGEQLQGPAAGQHECMHDIHSWNRDHAMSNIGTVPFHQYVQLVYFLKVSIISL
jgi:hypothetical protein